MMGEGKKLALLGAAALCFYLLFCAKEATEEPHAPEAGALPAMAQTSVDGAAGTTTLIRAPACAATEEESVFIPSQADSAVKMTISARNDVLVPISSIAARERPFTAP